MNGAPSKADFAHVQRLVSRAMDFMANPQCFMERDRSAWRCVCVASSLLLELSKSAPEELTANKVTSLMHSLLDAQAVLLGARALCKGDNALAVVDAATKELASAQRSLAQVAKLNGAST